MKIIHITGRRWFDRTWGNTYFSAIGYVDGEERARIDYEYGYGDHWRDRIMDELEAAKAIPERGDREAFWQYRERVGKITENVADVARKRDL